MTSHWFHYAECKGLDPNLFVPARWDANARVAAKTVCARCTVRNDCLEYAMADLNLDGIWGGLGHGARRKLLTARNRQKKGAA